jgi:hypothetical protein
MCAFWHTGPPPHPVRILSLVPFPRSDRSFFSFFMYSGSLFASGRVADRADDTGCNGEAVLVFCFLLLICNNGGLKRV